MTTKQNEELRALLAKSDAPNGHDWMHPWRVVPSDGKPIIASNRGGNLFRGYIATWDQADLIVAVMNALPDLLDLAAQSLTERSTPESEEDAREVLARFERGLKRAEQFYSLDQQNVAINIKGWTVFHAPGDDPLTLADLRAMLRFAQQSASPASEVRVEVRKVETVTGDFVTEPGEPFWRIEINGYCADFDHEQAARNFAAQIKALPPSSGAAQQDAGAVRRCTVCTAIVASYPEGMCCHCRELPWPVENGDPATPDASSGREALVDQVKEILKTEHEYTDFGMEDAFFRWPEVERVIHQALAARPAAKPEGWVMVPREPTEAMIEAARDSVNPIGCCLMDDIDAAIVFRAMLSASPSTPPDPESAG
jgi:hypothetical protein